MVTPSADNMLRHYRHDWGDIPSGFPPDFMRFTLAPFPDEYQLPTGVAIFGASMIVGWDHTIVPALPYDYADVRIIVRCRNTFYDQQSSSLRLFYKEYYNLVSDASGGAGLRIAVPFQSPIVPGIWTDPSPPLPPPDDTIAVTELQFEVAFRQALHAHGLPPHPASELLWNDADLHWNQPGTDARVVLLATAEPMGSGGGGGSTPVPFRIPQP